ncbi:MAG TPA: prepilin peptidase [Candidatus Saccharimonadales bacterium]|nr:prepilin peptidase [Candidatus Saccharimonadales bacterium]
MIYAVLVVLGLCLGSFVNALVWRLRQQSQTTAKSPYANRQSSAKKSKQQGTGDRRQATGDYSILQGRSMCPHCKHTLAAKDLVPVLSWLTLGGKCRYCRKPISWQYPVVELLTAAIFVASYIWWPLALDGRGIFDLAIWLLIVVCFMALSLYDLKWFELPDRVVVPVTALITIQSIVDAFIFRGGWQELAARAAGMVIIGGLFFGLYVLSKGNWIGFGDVKIAPALGLLAATPFKSLLVIFLASVLGTLAAVPLLARGKASRNTHIPFGPFLLLATAITVLFGNDIIQAYLNLMQLG